MLPILLLYREKTPAEVENYVAIAGLIFLWPALAIQTKRWHDRNKSGWWCLIMLIPYIGPIWAGIENGLLLGTDGENEFGKNPLSQNKQENDKNT